MLVRIFAAAILGAVLAVGAAFGTVAMAAHSENTITQPVTQYGDRG